MYPGPDGTIAHAELTLHGGMVMLGSQKNDEFGRGFKSPKDLGGFATSSAYVVVPDADAVYQRAQAAGAAITRPIEEMHYGSREFTLTGPGGAYLERWHLRSMEQAGVDSSKDHRLAGMQEADDPFDVRGDF